MTSPTERFNTLFPAVCVAAFGLLILIYSPGYMSPDSLSFYRYARAEELLLYHPPLLSYLFKLGIPFGESQAPVFLLQTALLVGGVAATARVFLTAQSARIAFVVVVLFMPTLFGFWGVLWKSVWLTGFGLFAICAAYRFWAGGRIGYLIAFVLCAGVSSMIRLETVVVWGVALLFVAHRSVVGKSAQDLHGLHIKQYAFVAGLALVGVLTLYLATSAVNRALTVEDKYPIHVTQYFDLFGVAVESGEVVLPEYVLARNGGSVSVENIAEAYNPMTCNDFLRFIDERAEGPFVLTRPANDDQAKALREAWFAAIFEHPLSYLGHRLSLLYHALGFDGAAYAPYFARVAANRFGLESAPSPAKTAAKSYVDFSVRHYTYLHLPLSFVVLGLVVAAVLVVLFVRGSRTQLGAPLLFLGSGFLHLFVLGIASAAADFRFYIWFIVCVLAAAFVAGQEVWSIAWRNKAPNPT